MDNPDIYLDICRYCCGTGETGLGFHQECEACAGSGKASPPDSVQPKQAAVEDNAESE